MGTIRTLLALCVAVFHSYTIGGLHFTGGRVAVQCFYIISGFYMALILNEKYIVEKYSYKAFIKSRFLRIYPAYLFVLLVSFAVSLIALYVWDKPFYLGHYISYWDKMSLFTKFYFVFENIFLMGQEFLFFLKLNFEDGTLSFTHDTFMEKPQLILIGFTFVPPAWTLSIEFTFYLLAPFIVRRKWQWQALLLLGSLGLRAFLIHVMNWKYDPWTYRFFPNELAFFIAGILLYRLYTVTDKIKNAGKIGLGAFILIIVSILFYDKVDYDYDKKAWYFYVLFAAALPFIFSFTKNSRVDRAIGELSFPIYLVHHLIMFLLRQYFWKHTEQMEWFGISVVACTIPVSILLYYFIIRPFDSIRLKSFNNLNFLKVK